MSAQYSAAWVPDVDPELPWNEASALAVEWIEEQAAQHNTEAILVTNAYGMQTFNSPLSRFVRGRSHFTPRTGAPTDRGVPVLSFAPTMEALEFAIQMARGSALCVVESDRHPVSGWASEVGATNLLTGTVEVPHTAAFSHHLERLVLYGNNNFGDQFGKKMAGHILIALQQDHLLDRDVLVGALAARGISPRGQAIIAQLIDRMNGSGGRG